MATYKSDSEYWASALSKQQLARMQLALRQFKDVVPEMDVPEPLKNHIADHHRVNYISAVRRRGEVDRYDWTCHACGNHGTDHLNQVTGMMFGLGVCLRGDCEKGINPALKPRCLAEIVAWQLRHIRLRLGSVADDEIRYGKELLGSLCRRMLNEVNVMKRAYWLAPKTSALTVTADSLQLSSKPWTTAWVYATNSTLWSPDGEFQLSDILTMSERPMSYVVEFLSKKGLTMATLEELCDG